MGIVTDERIGALGGSVVSRSEVRPQLRLGKETQALRAADIAARVDPATGGTAGLWWLNPICSRRRQLRAGLNGRWRYLGRQFDGLSWMIDGEVGAEILVVLLADPATTFHATA